MKLSGWARLWIVVAVIWWGAGAFYVVPKWPEDPGPEIAVKPGCEMVAENPELFRDSPLIIGMCENSQTWSEHRADVVKQWDDFIPLLVGWLVAPFAALFFGIIVRWIAAGFRPPAENSSQPESSDSTGKSSD